MRKAFIESLLAAAKADPRIWLLCGDLGFSVLDPFAVEFPERYINCGVAEQNMIGVAAGLAKEGKIPFVYSIANFSTLRCLEQIRNDVAYHDLPVRIVSVGAGFAYGAAGFTHFGIEEVAALRAFPNLLVVSPGDPIEAAASVTALARDRRPAYLRLGKGGETAVHPTPLELTLGHAIQVQDGDQATVLASGSLLATAVEAANDLAASGINIRVLSVPTIAPLDSNAIQKAAYETGNLVTVEEHTIGGLGSAVAELVATEGLPAKLKMVCIGKERTTPAGGHAFLRSEYGLTADQIVSAVRSLTQRQPV